MKWTAVVSLVVACSAGAIAVADDVVAPAAADPRPAREPAVEPAKTVALVAPAALAAGPAAAVAAPAVAPALATTMLLPAPAGVVAAGMRPEDIKGQRYAVKLRSGREVVGVVRPQDPWEVRDDGAGLHARAKNAGDRAGVRLWYVGNSNGYTHIDGSNIEKIRSLGTLESADSSRISVAISGAEDRAESERRRIRLRHSAIGNDYVRDTVAEALVASVRTRAEEQGKALGELLTKFPPDKWTIDTPLEIARRQRDKNIEPTAEEKEFLRQFDDWKLALSIWNSVGSEPATTPSTPDR